MARSRRFLPPPPAPPAGLQSALVVRQSLVVEVSVKDEIELLDFKALESAAPRYCSGLNRATADAKKRACRSPDAVAGADEEEDDEDMEDAELTLVSENAGAARNTPEGSDDRIGEDDCRYIPGRDVALGAQRAAAPTATRPIPCQVHGELSSIRL